MAFFQPRFLTTSFTPAPISLVWGHAEEEVVGTSDAMTFFTLSMTTSSFWFFEFKRYYTPLPKFLAWGLLSD
ncbi:MAG: hypothetical protein COY83_00315 [Parcubacteria group bacterium CG_4_10_14_0_8_um_filter_48_154]|nr:MAG: hypothetical protein AUK21_00925 [Parcubacteria group bacterium CG2_30_48_51]PIY78368.1 MAG: hypothetical protein COY83_00315 [Parcubacteria group bacterium CG_4_10_14_0_8_um_filter_48_154]